MTKCRAGFATASIGDYDSSGKATPTFGHSNANFCVYKPYKESISKEICKEIIMICICMTKCQASFATASIGDYDSGT